MSELLKKKQINAVDLFCGAGGLTHGLNNAGINVVAGYDIDIKCKYAYEHNNSTSSFICKSITDVQPEEVAAHFSAGSYSLLSGCAPCQTFSSINRGASPKDLRWSLLLEFSRLIKEIKPDFLTMENVPGIVKQDIFSKFLNVLQECGYRIDYKIINCADYGIPQSRRRLVLLASRLFEVKIPSANEYGASKKTVRDIISGLEEISAGESSRLDELHYSKGLSEKNLLRIESSIPGGSWKDWNEDLRCECHKKPSGSSYTAVYGRMKWDEPSPTITTQFFNYGSGRFGHPDQARAISFREGALLQTFPSDYEFYESGKKLGCSALGDLIGNAVPVDLGRMIGKVFIESINRIE